MWRWEAADRKPMVWFPVMRWVRVSVVALSMLRRFMSMVTMFSLAVVERNLWPMRLLPVWLFEWWLWEVIKFIVVNLIITSNLSINLMSSMLELLNNGRNNAFQAITFLNALKLF